MPEPAPSDPFDTAGVRRATVAAWRATILRFREDAAAEDELVRGGYRGRAAYELAQNAADAAAQAGVAGSVLFDLIREADAAVLYAANTGAPLDAEGVSGVASLRASGKRDTAAIGRFGLGFTAVLELTAAPSLFTKTGGVRFTPDETRALIDADPALEAVRRELDDRPGRPGTLPILRLPFPAEPTGHASELLDRGFDTVIRLPLRSEAVGGAREQLAQLGDPALLALDALGDLTVKVDGNERRCADAASRWQVVRAAGTFTDDDRAALPPGADPHWWLAWALPAEASMLTEPVIHAPTPSTEAIGLPALLLGSFPVEPDRRRLADTAATASLCAEAGTLYARLVADYAGDHDLTAVTRLLPGGLPASPADSRVREAASESLTRRRWLRRSDGTAAAPPDVRILEGPGAALAADLSARMPELLICPPDPELRAELRELGVRGVGLDEVIEAYPCNTPQDAAELLTILSGEIGDSAVAEAAALVPVPLLTAAEPDGGDGRPVQWRRGARGLLMPGGFHAGDLAALGLPTVHPDAMVDGAAGVLERLGAAPPEPGRVLELLGESFGLGLVDGDEGAWRQAARVRREILAVVTAAVETSADPADAATFVRHPWLAEVPLLDSDGEPTPAADLYLPGSAAESLNDAGEEYPLDEKIARDYPASVLAAIGVRTGPVVVRAADLASDSVGDGEAGLDAVDDPTAWWLEDLERRFDGPVYVPDVTTILGLDLIADWPSALALMDGDAGLRAALTGRVPVMVDGDRHDVRGPAAAWIAGHVDVDGLPLGQHSDVAGPAGMSPGRAAPDWMADLSSEVRHALLATAPGDLDADGWQAVLDRLDGAGIAECVPVWTALAEAGIELDPAPSELAAIDPESGRAVRSSSANVFVAEAPYWLARSDLGRAVRASWARPELADDLASALDAGLGSELADQVLPAGHRAEYPRAVSKLCEALGLTSLPAYREHDDLRVDGRPVDWWIDHDTIHAATIFGLSRALAWATGRWEVRDALFAVATGDQTVPDVLGEMG